MKYMLLLLGMLMQNCQFANNSSPVSDDAGDDFRSRLSKGKDVYVENQEIEKELDFTQLVSAYSLSPGTKRGIVGGSVTFIKCRFKSRVIAYHNDPGGAATATSFARNLTFVNCTFDEEVNFRACSVQDLASFSNCTFVKKAIFEEGDFADNAVFSQSQFQSDARFQNTFFRKRADFLKVEFDQSVNFQGAVFTLDAQFGNLKSFKYADFSLVQFNGHAFFNYAECHGRATFDEAWFKGRTEFMQVKFVTTSMKNCWFFCKPRFNKTTVDISLDLEGCHWAGEQPDWAETDQQKVLNYKG